MNLPDPLLPPVPLVYRSQEVFLYQHIGSSWSSNLSLSMYSGPQEYITYEFILTSPAVSHMSGSSNLDSFRDGR